MNAQQLALEMNVTESDVNSLLNMVCNSIKQDLADEAFIALSVEDRAEMVCAYVQSEVKKFSEFCVTLMTNDEKRNAFNLYLYSQLSD